MGEAVLAAGQSVMSNEQISGVEIKMSRSEVTTDGTFLPDSASFRDRASRVYVSGNTVIRTLSQAAWANWDRLKKTKFYNQANDAGQVIGTRETVAADLPGTPRVLAHDRIPVISYPYEWSFSMLKDAALLHLELMRAALNEGFILKDATPYNIQWLGTRPVLIDIPSFEPYNNGEPWQAYGQFCELFLFPLMLRAYKGIAFQPLLRGSLEGILPEQMAKMMSLRDRLRPGVLTHVVLHAALKRSNQSSGSPKDALRSAGFGLELIKANVAKLTKLVRGLSLPQEKSTWSDYEAALPYTGEDRARKEAFVAEVTKNLNCDQVWDVGANTGTFSRISAHAAVGPNKTVLALDFDELAIDKLYCALKSGTDKRAKEAILPLVYNVTNPSPSLGWGCAERRNLSARTQPDLILALAVIHHLTITGNVPLTESIKWFASLGRRMVIEFVHKSDPMVQRLLQNRVDQYDDYEPSKFEEILTRYYKIERRELLASGTRTLYLVSRD